MRQVSQRLGRGSRSGAPSPRWAWRHRSRRPPSPRTRRGRSTARARRRSIASSPTATRSTPATTARSPTSPSAPRRGSTASTSRSCGTPTSRSSAAPSRAPSRRDIYNNKIVAERSYMQATNTRVVTFEMCGNDGLQARSSFAGQSGTCNYGAARHRARATARPTSSSRCTTSTHNAYAGDEAEGRLEPLLPGLRRRQRAQHLHRSGDRAAGQQAERRSCRTSRKMNWRACNFAQQLRLRVRRQLRAVHGRRLRLERRRPDRLRRAPLRPGRVGSGLRHPHHHARCARRIRDANTHFANASTSYDYIQSDDTHPTYTGVDRRRRHLRRHAARARARRTTAARRSSAARTRSGTSSATSAWAGRCRSSTIRRPDRVGSDSCKEGARRRSRLPPFAFRSCVAAGCDAGEPPALPARLLSCGARHRARAALQRAASRGEPERQQDRHTGVTRPG